MSHSSRDAEALVRLKDLLAARTSGTIEFFLSCDGSSLTAGRNWMEHLVSAIKRAGIVFIFLSPDSLRSQWIFFEAGLAYDRAVQVVPVGIAGVNVGELPSPLGLLTGFNLDSKQGLRTLIQILNESLSHSHSADFTDRDFERFDRDPSEEKPSVPDGLHPYRVFSTTPDGEKRHERLEIEIQHPRMTVRANTWESFGIIDRNRYVGRFKFNRGSSPHDLGIHDFTWDGKEFRGSAKLDSGKWVAEGLIWRPLDGEADVQRSTP